MTKLTVILAVTQFLIWLVGMGILFVLENVLTELKKLNERANRLTKD